MNQQDKEAERNRLHDIVFEGISNIDCFESVFAAMDKDNQWWYYYSYFDFSESGNDWQAHNGEDTCPNQPETFLDWTETLIQRKV